MSQDLGNAAHVGRTGLYRSPEEESLILPTGTQSSESEHRVSWTTARTLGTGIRRGVLRPNGHGEQGKHEFGVDGPTWFKMPKCGEVGDEPLRLAMPNLDQPYQGGTFTLPCVFLGCLTIYSILLHDTYCKL